jgi:3-phenylpropionate/trans-cinnamate dioxygenase ferredoxin subunit
MPTIWVRATTPPPGGATRVVSGDVAVAVFDAEGELVAFDDRCLHRGGSLSSGFVHGSTVTCPEHWWRYDLHTGERLGSPGLCLRRYPVVRDGDAVLVGLPPAPPVTSIREALLRHAREWERDG